MDIVLPRQNTNYTCGIAALSAVTKILSHIYDDPNYYLPQVIISSMLSSIPNKGVCHHKMAEWAESNLPVTNHGCDQYDDLKYKGLAIANIKNKDSHIGHYVVILGERSGVVRYYCPLLGSVVEQEKEDIIWKNSTGEVCNWSININIDQDVFDLKITPETQVFFIGDPEETLHKKIDSSLLLKKGYERHGYHATWHTSEDIFIKNKQLYLSGVPVLENDLVWLRNDPVNSVHYYELLRQLCHVNAKILNSPQSILTFHDKLSTMHISDNSLYSASSLDNVKRAYRHLTVDGYQEFIVKAPSEFGGKSIYKASSLEELIEHAETLISDSGYVIIQGYIKTGIEQIDTRVVITQDDVLGMLDRVAPEGSYICNISKGGTVRKNKGLTDWQKVKISETQQLMKEHDIFIAGVDFLGDFIIEINISCPSACVLINEISGGTIENKIVQATAKDLKSCIDLIELCHKQAEAI